jgi:hypothetical protein
VRGFYCGKRYVIIAKAAEVKSSGLFLSLKIFMKL